MPLVFLIAAIASLLPSTGLAAATTPTPPQLAPVVVAAEATVVPPGNASATRRPRVGLVLSGGGARGLTHIGVLRVLEEMRIPIDYIAATSMGAIVGGLYAVGMSPTEMERRMGAADWPTLFSDSPPRQDLGFRRKEEEARFPLAVEIGYRDGEFRMFKGALSGSNLELFLHELVRKVDDLPTFDALPIRYRAIATDMVTGKEVVFDRGPLYKAMRASMSVPGMFSPAEIDGRILGDGGLVKNLPVDIVKAMGAEVVIAVNIGTPLMSRERLSSVVGFAAQMINILTEQNVREQLALLGPADILISPDLGDLTFTDFTAGAKFIELGRQATLPVRDQLARLAVSESAFAAYEAGLVVLDDKPPKTVDFVRIEGAHYANPEVLAEQMTTRAGAPFDLPTLHKDVMRLYGRGDMELIDYRLVEENGTQGLAIEVQEKSWGPNYLRFGVALSTDFHGDSGFRVLVGHKRAWVNALGGEWRNDIELGRLRRYATEFYQPLSVGNYVFASAWGSAQVRPEMLFAGDTAVAEYSIGEGRVGVDLGAPLGIYGEARLGYRYYRASGDPAIAVPDFPSVTATESGVRLLARWDSLDDPFFPRHGIRGEVEAFTGRRSEKIGAQDLGHSRVDRLQAAGEGSVALSRDGVANVGLRFGKFRSDRSDILTDYNLGGFLNLSGYRTDQLTGSNLAFVRAVYLHQITTAPWLGRGGIYAGGSIEAGNTWGNREQLTMKDLISAGSLFVAADTWLGPLYFAWGRASGNHQAFYIYLGRP